MTDSEVKTAIKAVMATRFAGVEGDLLTFLVEEKVGKHFQVRRITRCALELGKAGEIRVTEREDWFYSCRWIIPVFWQVKA